MTVTRKPFGSKSVLANSGNVSQVLYSSSPIIKTMCGLCFGSAARAVRQRRISQPNKKGEPRIYKEFKYRQPVSDCYYLLSPSLRKREVCLRLDRLEKPEGFLHRKNAFYNINTPNGAMHLPDQLPADAAQLFNSPSA